MRNLLHNRTVTSFLLSLLLIIVVQFFKLNFIKFPESETDPLPDWFWIQKVDSKKDADLIIIGDSRTYRGLATKEMEKILIGKKMINLGFSSGGLNHVSYGLVNNWLNPVKEKSVILIAVSPYSLTEDSSKNTHYLEILNKADHLASWEKGQDYAKITKYFEPVKFSDLKYLVMEPGKPMFRYIQKPYEGGWVASTRIPNDQNLALKEYTSFFVNNKVSSKLIKDNINQIRIWQDQKICVYGVRLPVSDNLKEIENNLSGFNEINFIDQFVKAGGIWLEIQNDKDYRTYDGGHLDEKSAINLSRELAISIKDRPCPQ